MRPASLTLCLALAFFVTAAAAKDVVLYPTERDALLSQSSVWFADREPLIPTLDVFNGPPNPYNITVGEVIDCDFIEPNPAAPEGGVTPKFLCLVNLTNGLKVPLKVKYDQRFNPVLHWGKGNNEVYATPVVQRLLWALGFGADVVVPVTIRCHGCPVEPWTYIRKTCGLQSNDYVSGWVDLFLIATDKWQEKVDVLELNSTLAYLDFELFEPGDHLLLAGTPPQPGWGWPEMYENITPGSEAAIERDALTVIAAFFSHVDNYAGNQGFSCIFSNGTRASLHRGKYKIGPKGGDGNYTCDGTPFLYLHDVGCTLGYGWDLAHFDLWPDALDLKQWLELELWADLSNCTVQIHGIPGASWLGKWQVSEAGRALAARLLGALTPAQMLDMFTVARVELFRGDTPASWAAGWAYKLQREVLNVTCGTPPPCRR